MAAIAGAPDQGLSRRTVLKAATAFAGAAALAGCSTSSADELVVGYYGSTDQLTTTRAAIEAFAKSHPKIKVRATYADSAGFFEKLPLLFRSGGAPDVFFAAESWISGLASLHGYLDVRKRMADDGLKRDRWLEGAFSGVDVGGKTYGLPVTVYPRGIVYNKTLFKDRGAKTPETGWHEADWLAAAKKVAHGDGVKRVWGTTQWTGGGANPPFDLPTMYGSMIFDITTRKMKATDPKVVRAVSFVQKWIREYRIAPAAGTAAALTAGFPAGLFGMDQFPGYNAIPYAAQIGKKFEYDVVPFPLEWKGTFQNNNVCIFSGSKKQDDAWTFAKWAALDPKAQALLGASATPVEKNAAADWIKRPAKGFEKIHWQPLVDRLKDQGVAYQGGDFNKIWAVLNSLNESVQIQGTDPMKAMEQLDARGRAILSVSES